MCCLGRRAASSTAAGGRDNKDIRHEEFLDSLFEETFSREGTLGWLRVRHGAGGVYTCTGVSRYPEIQLDPVDAARLFSAPTAKYETVIVVPL